MAKTLTVVLAADVDNFRRKMRSAEGQMDDFGRAGGRMGGMASGLGTAMAGAAVAAGALAVALGVDAVKAAMDEEQSLASLNRTLANLGFAGASAGVEAFINDLQYASNVSDGTLRPAFDRLIRSTGDVEQSQKLLKIALDVSAGTGKSLDSVVQALGRAYDGNTGSLGKLGAGLSKAQLATGDMDVITKQLAKTFEGQAKTASETLKGKVDGIKLAADELSEAFGTGLVNGLADAVGGMDNLEAAMRDAGPAMETLGSNTIKVIIGLYHGAVATFYELAKGLDAAAGAVIDFRHLIGSLTDAEYAAAKAENDLAYAQAEAGAAAASAAGEAAWATLTWNEAAVAFDAGAMSGGRLAQTIGEVGHGAMAAKPHVEDLGGGLDGLGNSAEKATPKFDAMKERVAGLTDLLKQQAAEVVQAAEAITSWRETMTTTLMGGVSLQAAFEQQGSEGGVSLLEAFRQQLANVGNFGGLLEQLKQSGASDELINQIAGMGPDMGSKLAKQMIDEGLVKTISDEWKATRDKIYEITSTIVPDFLLLGQEEAIKMMDGTEQQIEKSEKRLRAIGQKVGKPIGAEIKDAIAQAVAAAVAAAEASGRAAARNITGGGATGGGSSAGTVTGTSFGTPQAGAAALQIWLNQANSRAGITAPKVFA